MNTSIYGIRYLYINICKHTCVNISFRSDGVGPARIQTGDSIRYCVHCFLCFVQFLLSIGWSKYPTIVTVKNIVRGGGVYFFITREIFNVRCQMKYCFEIQSVCRKLNFPFHLLRLINEIQNVLWIYADLFAWRRLLISISLRISVDKTITKIRETPYTHHRQPHIKDSKTSLWRLSTLTYSSMSMTL